MTTERIDVLAVMDGLLAFASRGVESYDPARLMIEAGRDARAAVAELIEKANVVAYAFSSDTGDHIHGFCLGVNEVRDLRAALARVGGA